MKFVTLYSFLILFTVSAFSQSQPATSVILQPCNNVESAPGIDNYYGQPKEFKRLKKKYDVEIRINSIVVGQNGILDTTSVDFYYSEKIKDETQLVKINDTIAIQFQLLRTAHNNQKNLYCMLKVLYKDNVCWRETSIPQIEAIFADKMSFGWRSSGGAYPVPRVSLNNVSISIK